MGRYSKKLYSRLKRMRAEPPKTAEPATRRQGGNTVALIVSAIALVGTIVNGYWQSEANKAAAELNFKASERSSDIKMIDIAVSILRAPVSDDFAPMRTWAMDVIDLSSKRQLTREERSALLHKPLGFAANAFSVNGNSLLSGVPDLCSAFRHNPDGSWTQTRKIVTRGNNTFENLSFKGTGEAQILDHLCGPS